MKNFEEFLNEKFDETNLDLHNEIREYLLTNYPGDWWAEELTNNVDNYISQDDMVGSGDEDDESTWEYESMEDAYQNLCTGGAIEYDLLDEIRNDVKKKFSLTDQDYDDGIGDIVEDHMCKVCDWYDTMLFGENSGDFLGMNKGINDLMASMGKWDNIKGWDEPTPKEKEDFYKIKGIDTKNLPNEIKGPNGTIKL